MFLLLEKGFKDMGGKIFLTSVSQWRLFFAVKFFEEVFGDAGYFFSVVVETYYACFCSGHFFAGGFIR